MSNRDLGTAILNIKIQFEKINTTELDKKVKDAVSQINQALSAAQQAKSVKQVGESVGASIVEGISEGVEKTTPEAKATVEGLGKKIESWFYKTLRINSPSKVTMDIGVSIVQGLIAGITRGKGGFQKAIEQFANSGVDSLKGGLDQISELQIKIAKSVDLLNKERAKDPADQNPERIKNLIKIRQNLAEELRMLRERNKLEPDFNIDSFNKKRADEIERATRGLARQSTPIIKLVGILRQLDDTYLKSGKGLKNLTSAAGVAENEFNKYFKTLINNNKAAFEGAAGLTQLQTQYDKIEKRIRKNIKDTDLQREALKKLTASFEQQRKLVQGLAVDKAFTAASTKLSKPMGREQLVKTIQDLQRLIAELRGINVETGRFEKLLGKAQRQLKQMDARQLENVRRVFHTITSGVNQFGEQLRRVSFILRDVGRQLMTIGKTGFRYVMPLVDDFSKYEQAVTDVLATTGDLNNNLTKTDVLTTSLSKTILDLAGNFMFSAEEIAGVAKQLALAGFSTQQIEGALSSVLQLASATGSDLTTAANIAISAMSTFGLEAENVGRVADVFAATVTRSNTNLNQLSEAFKVVAPVAAQMGQSIEETAAALGILANAGLKGTVAGTGLSRILTQLIEKSDSFDATLKGLGSGFDRIDPRKNNFSDIIKEFERLNLSSSTLLKNLDLRAYRTLNATLAQTADRLGSLADQLERAEGVAEAISGARLQTLAASMQLLSDAATSLRISLGSLVANEAVQLLDFIRELTVGIREFVELNKESLQPVFKFIIAILGSITSLGVSLFGLGSAASFAAAPIILFGSVLAGLSAIVGGAAQATTALGLAFAPVLAGILAIGAVVSGTFIVAMGTVSAIFVSIAASVANFTELWGEFFSQVVDTTSALINTILPKLFKGFSNNLGQIEAATNRLINVLGSTLNLEDLFLTDWENIGEFAASLVAYFIELAAIIVTELKPSIDGLTNSLRGLSDVLGILQKYSVGPQGEAEGTLQALNIIKTVVTGNTVPAALQASIGFGRGLFSGETKDKPGDKPEAQNAAVKAFRDQAEALADITIRAGEAASALNKIEPILGKLGTASAVELSKLTKLVDSGFANPEGRKALLAEIEGKIKELNALREKFPSDDPARFDIDRRIRELQKSSEVISSVGEQFDKINDLIKNKTPDQIAKEFGDIVTQEQEKIKEINAIQDEILKVRKKASIGALGKEEVEALQSRISAVLGTKFEVDMSNPAQSFEAALRNGLQSALQGSEANLTLVRQFISIIPELKDVDLTDPEKLKGVLDAFAKAQDDATVLSKTLYQAQEDQLKIQQEIDKLGMNAFERRKKELEMEAKARKDRLKDIQTTLKLERDQLARDLRAAEVEGKPTEAIKASIQANQENLKANAELGNQLGFGKFVNGEFQFDENDDLIQDKLKTNEELANMDMEARKQAELEIAEARLEVEEDTAERIRLKQQLIDAKRDKELADRLDNLRQNMDPTANMDERIRLEKELTDAVNAAREKEKLDVEAQENEKAQKDQEDALDKNKQQAEKRVDLENELLNNLGKQVTSLQQMAMLMQFIEVIQRRKDQAALRALRELSKEEQKLVRMRLRGGGDDKAMAAIKAQEDLVAFMRGKVARNIGQAGAQGGDPRGIFNIQAFLARLNQAMTDFVDGLKANPLIIPAKFDKEMLVKSLKDAVKGFRIEDMAGMLGGGIGINSHTVGANFGTINHNDNRVINVNVNRLTADVARPLGMMNS